jgi:hypothetical protein
VFRLSEATGGGWGYTIIDSGGGIPQRRDASAPQPRRVDSGFSPMWTMERADATARAAVAALRRSEEAPQS